MWLHNKDKNLPKKTAFASSAAVKTGVQKASLVACMIRGMSVSEALLQLKFCHKKSAKYFATVLRSAIANAENNYGYDIDRLYISRAIVDKAYVLKRFRAAAKGRASRISKAYSRLSITVSEGG